MSKPTPWARLLRLGLHLGVAPHAFWRLSVREWRAMTMGAEDALGRAAFEALCAAHPDRS